MVGVSVSAVRLYHFVLTTPGLERWQAALSPLSDYSLIVLKILIEYQVFHPHNCV